MKKYKPIACYDSAEDIFALFPCDQPKPDMGDIVYDHYKNGMGTPRAINATDDVDAFWTETEVENDANFILTTDKRHGVYFTHGSIVHGVPVGFYIDIYELVEDAVTMVSKQIRTTKRTTKNGVRYSFSGLTFDQVFRIKNAMLHEAERLEGIIANELSGHEEMKEMFEGYRQDCLDVYWAACDAY